jgi:transposase
MNSAGLPPIQPLPEDTVIVGRLGRTPHLPSTCVSTLEPFREQITRWFEAEVQCTTIHSALKRNHGYTGSYSAVRRFLTHLASERGGAATTILEFSPADAAQVDFGAGPALLIESGHALKTWFFVMTLCWSRHQYVELVFDQTVET